MATFEEIMNAARNADAAGDEDAARRLVQMAIAARDQANTGGPDLGVDLPMVAENPNGQENPLLNIGADLPMQAPERTFMDAVVDNVVGTDDGVTSPGEQAGRMVNAVGAGVARGVEGLANLPNLLGSGFEYATDRTLLPAMAAIGVVDPENVEAIRETSGNVPINLPSMLTDFDPQNRAERYAGTVGEFLPGAGAFGTASVGKNLTQFGLLPGVASEAAGEATEGTALEPFARIAAATVAPAAMATRAPASTASALRPDADRIAASNYIQQRGVTPTAGQSTGSDLLRRLEDAAAPTSQQLDDFTASAMDFIGSPATRATPEALRTAQQSIVQRLDDAVKGVEITPTPSMGQTADDIALAYVERVPSGQLVPRIRGMVDEIVDASTSEGSIPLSVLKKWRSDIGRMTTSPDNATREAAHSLRVLIDDATDTALQAAGRESDIAALGAARNDYRNFLAIRDAATRAGAEGGGLSPTQLNQSVIRTQGRDNYGIGRTTDLGDFTRASAEVLRPLSTVSPGGVRAIEGGASAGLGLLGFQYGGVSGALAGLAAPIAGRVALKTPAVQNAIAAPATAVRGIIPLISGGLADGATREGILSDILQRSLAR